MKITDDYQNPALPVEVENNRTNDEDRQLIDGVLPVLHEDYPYFASSVCAQVSVPENIYIDRSERKIRACTFCYTRLNLSGYRVLDTRHILIVSPQLRPDKVFYCWYCGRQILQTMSPAHECRLCIEAFLCHPKKLVYRGEVPIRRRR